MKILVLINIPASISVRRFFGGEYAIFITMILMVAVFFSCDKQSSFVESPVNLLDNEFLSIAYDRTYFYPNGFYQDPALPEHSINYINTYYVSPVNQQDVKWIELSTNDQNEALIWLNLTISNSPDRINILLIEQNETEKYFEFKCKEITDDIFERILLFRVHKTNYYRSIFDSWQHWNHDNETEEYGYYNAEMSDAKVKECIEYLWVQTTFANLGQKVLISKVEERNDYYEVYISSLLTIYGDWGLHDTINVYDNYFRLNKDSRLLSFERSLQKQILGRYNAGAGR
jgi:hypothetical protein